MIDAVKGVEVALEMGEVDADEHRIRQRVAGAFDDRLEVAENLLSLRFDAVGKGRRRGEAGSVGNWPVT